MFRSFILFLTALFFLESPAMAQDTLYVRTGAHPDYSRLVFDGQNKKIPYEFKKLSGTSVSLTFPKGTMLDLRNMNLAETPDIDELVATDIKNGIVKINISAGHEVRHFNVGNRIVVDILNGTKEGRKQEAKRPNPVPETATSKVERAEVEVVAEKSVKPPPETALEDIAQEHEQVRVQENNLGLLQAAMGADPHVITLSLTEPVGLAVFERGRSLWIVMDRDDVKVVPEITGPQAGVFAPFRRYELEGGMAFRMQLPSNMNFFTYGEGGGLVWRVVLSPKLRKLDKVNPEHSFMRNQIVRGGTVLWPLKMNTKVLDVYDPTVGDTLKVVTVEQADQMSGVLRNHVDFTALHSVIGLAIAPKADDLTVSLTSGGIAVTRPGGLALSRDRDISLSTMRKGGEGGMSHYKAPAGSRDMLRIFDFDRWMMGGTRAIWNNQSVLMATMAEKDEKGRVHDLLTLAKMNLANGRGVEAIAFLDFASDEMPDLEKGAEFLALRGAARAFAGQSDIAFKDIMMPVLDKFGEINYWRAFTLAELEDWQQAIKLMPEDMSLLLQYPRPLFERMALKLAEVALRAGNVSQAEELLNAIRLDEDSMEPWTVAGMGYLEGEAARQSGNIEKAKRLWGKLARGRDDFYRARSGLALTMLEKEDGSISDDEVIDRLEGLRYLWRGDELEAKVNFMLGRLYFERRDYLKGLTILRDAATMSPHSDIAREIASYMSENFNHVLLEDRELSALDAVTIFEEFRELTPGGDAGNHLIQALAERLVDADLLGRAARILQHQIDFRLQAANDEKGRVALRLATIYLLGKDAQGAMAALDVAEQVYKGKNGNEATARLRDIALLRARALSDMGKTQQALDSLSRFPPAADVNKLRADIAWQAGAWNDAAKALDDLIFDEGIDAGRPLTQSQAELILNRAITLNLAGDRVELSNMRKRYGEAMKQTQQARLFDVVTRERKSTMLADRDTLTGIVNEVDIFRDFLDSYRDMNRVSN